MKLLISLGCAFSFLMGIIVMFFATDDEGNSFTDRHPNINIGAFLIILIILIFTFSLYIIMCH